jgi:hypothetical protein
VVVLLPHVVVEHRSSPKFADRNISI